MFETNFVFQEFNDDPKLIEFQLNALDTLGYTVRQIFQVPQIDGHSKFAIFAQKREGRVTKAKNAAEGAR